MLQALIGPVTGLLDKFIEDKDQKAKLAHEIATMSEKHAQAIALAQIEVNKAEAAIVFDGGKGTEDFIGQAQKEQPNVPHGQLASTGALRAGIVAEQPKA